MRMKPVLFIPPDSHAGLAEEEKTDGNGRKHERTCTENMEWE